MTSPEAILEKYTKVYPRFADGRIDYTNARDCVVLNSLIQFQEEILLIQRSERVHTYPKMWSGVSGYIDRNEFVENLMLQELDEELGIKKEAIKKMTVNPVLTQEDVIINKIWHVFPVHVELTEKPSITLNWETQKYEWIVLRSLDSYPLLPGYLEVISVLL